MAKHTTTKKANGKNKVTAIITNEDKISAAPSLHWSADKKAHAEYAKKIKIDQSKFYNK